VLIAPAAVEVLPDLSAEPVESRPGFMRLVQSAQASERTTTRMGVAPLVGRDDLMRKLVETARTATGGAKPTITTLLGDAGHGKTHLAQALVQNLELLPKIQTLFVRAKEVLGGAGEQTTRELLQRTLGLPDAGPDDLGREALAAKLGPDVAREVWAGVAVVMGWAPPEHPEVRALATAPGALRSAGARALGEAFRRLAHERPLALVVEDAHFVDETALDAIEYATLAEGGTAMWACVIARPTFGRGRTAWATRAVQHYDLTLTALEPPAAAELARRLLNPVENIPSSVLAKLAERTMGVPLLLVELCRGLKRDGIVRKSERGTWILATDELERLPDLPLVQWLSSRETESLPPDLAAHARLVSVLGAEFSSDEVEGVLQELERAGSPIETQLDAGIGLKRLADSGILTRHRGGRVGFRHALLRDTVYQSVPPPERESIHRAAYEYYRRHDDLPDAARLPPMALHASKSGLKQDAARLYLDLAGRASARHTYLDAELLYRSALDNLPEDDAPARITVGQGLGLMRFRLGRHDDALKDLSAALDLARQATALSAQLNLLLDEAIVLDWVMEWAKSRVLSEEADALVAAHPALETPLVRARLLMARGRTFHRTSRFAEAVTTLQEAIGAAERVGEEAYEPLTHSLNMLAFCATNIGRPDLAEETANRCLAVFAEHGDMLGIAGTLQNRCMLSLLSNNIERLISDLERIIQIAREYGFSVAENLAVRDLAEVSFLFGRSDEALRHARRALEMYKLQLGDSNRSVANVEQQLARIFWQRGDRAEAAAVTHRLLAKQAEAQASGRTDALLVDYERVLLDAVELSLRGGSGDAFDALVTRGRGLQLQPQDIVEIMEWKGLGALRAGRRDEGLRFLEDALAEAEKNAPIVADRLRGQIAHATAATDAPRAAEGA